MATASAPTSGRRLIAAAWVSTLLSIGAMYLGLLLVFDGQPVEAVWALFVGGGLGAILSMTLSFMGIRRRSGADIAHLLFDTWFPMTMAAVPLAGPFIALWSAIKLLIRDRLTAATITTSSGSSRNTTNYPAVALHGSGRAAGLLLFALAGLQPLIGMLLFVEEDQPSDSATAQLEAALAQGIALAPATDAGRELEAQACADVLDCFRRADHVGSLAGRIEMTISATGEVRRVDMRLPEAKDAIRACVKKLVQSRRFSAYRGPAGTLRCDFAGVLSGAAEQVDAVGRFSPDPEQAQSP